jgi:hypothetical protein
VLLLSASVLLAFDALHQGELAIILVVLIVIAALATLLSGNLFLRHLPNAILHFATFLIGHPLSWGSRWAVFLGSRGTFGTGSTSLASLGFAAVGLGGVSQSVSLLLFLVLVEFIEELVKITLPELINVHLLEAIMLFLLVPHELLHLDDALLSQTHDLHGQQVVVLLGWDLALCQLLFFLLDWDAVWVLLIPLGGELDTGSLLFRQNLIELRVSLEAELPEALDNFLPLNPIDLDLLRDDTLDEADLVQQGLKLFLKSRQHVLLPTFVELLSEDKELLDDVLLTLETPDLSFIVEEDVVVG